MLKKFMDDSFTKLRSAEDTFNLLQKFRSIQENEQSGKLMDSKTLDILQQYDKELVHVQTLFKEHQERPPLCKNQPPLAGAINWSHSLFLRIRKTMAKFQQMDELFSTDKGKEVSKRFVTVSKDIRSYETRLFEEWKENVNTKAMNLLKQPIFRAEMDGKEAPPETEGASIFVNFHQDLIVLIRESKYLDRMGFVVPETALNVTLQEDKYHSYVESLNAMLHTHRAVLESLSPVEAELLQSQVIEMRGALSKGFTLLNWNSLSIPEFTDSCNKSIRCAPQL